MKVWADYQKKKKKNTGLLNEGGHSSNKGMYGVYYISVCIKHVTLS